MRNPGSESIGTSKKRVQGRGALPSCPEGLIDLNFSRN